MTHVTGAPWICDNPRCRYCPKLNTDGHIVTSVTGKKYRARHNVSCNSNNLVYCISCTRCGKQYVGQTKNSLKQRFQGHFYQIVHDAEKTEVSRHFNGMDTKAQRMWESTSLTLSIKLSQRALQLTSDWAWNLTGYIVYTV